MFVYPPAGDLDGDGLDDVIVWWYKYEYATDTEKAGVIAKRGIDGTHLWEESISVTGGSCSMRTYPAGDLDGDGLDDVTVEWYKYEYATDTGTAGVIAKRGIDGTHFWEAQSDGRIWVVSGGYDLNGDGVCDTLLGDSNEVHAITVK
jgi:hypothetical protein